MVWAGIYTPPPNTHTHAYTERHRTPHATREPTQRSQLPRASSTYPAHQPPVLVPQRHRLVQAASVRDALQRALNVTCCVLVTGKEHHEGLSRALPDGSGAMASWPASARQAAVCASYAEARKLLRFCADTSSFNTSQVTPLKGPASARGRLAGLQLLHSVNAHCQMGRSREPEPTPQRRTSVCTPVQPWKLAASSVWHLHSARRR